MDSRAKGGPVHPGRIVASRFFGRAMYVGMRLLDLIQERSESPIEQIMARHLLLLDDGLSESTVVFAGMRFGDLGFPDARDIDDCIAAINAVPEHSYVETVVFQQISIGPYRADFVVGKVRPKYIRPEESNDAPRTALVVVECDGHEHHEKTKEQAARDKARDRYIQSLGLHVLRFTGSEIWNRPSDCVDEIDTLLCRATGIPGGGTSQDLKDINERSWCANDLADFFDKIEEGDRS